MRCLTEVMMISKLWIILKAPFILLWAMVIVGGMFWVEWFRQEWEEAI
jgi:hypothetical protein